VVMDFRIQHIADIDRLSVEAVAERLDYTDKALRRLRRELGEQTAVIGFAGSPWTLATFMMEGGSAENYTRAMALFREEPAAYNRLAEKLTVAVAGYLKMQAAAGADVLQIFDSHGGQLPADRFQEASGRWIKEVIQRLGDSGPAPRRGAVGSPGSALPVIVFSLGTHGNWDDLVGTGANVLGIDWQFPLGRARERVPETIGLQGNLAPDLLTDASAEAVARETARLIVEMRGRQGYIFNLGHGVPPTAKLENIAALVETVKQFK